jgi:C4-dicarboxylate-specific signal transduction histidine kinase
MPDGSIKHVHVVAHAVRDPEDQLEFGGAVMDVTATKRAEDELRKTQTELAHVTRVTMLGELTASIAHEVNQPLAAAIANAEACLRWLDRETPDIAKARRQEWGHDTTLASDVIRRVRALANKADIEKRLTSTLSSGSHRTMQHELISSISLRTELAAATSPIPGDRVQRSR